MECQNCNKEFDTPEIIQNEIRCPYCKSGDVIGSDYTIIYLKGFEDGKKELQQKIDNVIEYIKENFDKTGICVSGSDLPYSYIEELLEILRGKENE